MPKRPPAPIYIRIDTQEQRSGIPDLLAAMPLVHIEVAPLRVGDYDVGGNPRRVFERKTGSDFLGSLAQGRLFAQLTALRKSRFAPVLLLEGDPLRVSHSQMRPESIRGALAYITAILRVPILPSSGPTESAHLVYAAARQCQVGHAAHGHGDVMLHGNRRELLRLGDVLAQRPQRRALRLVRREHALSVRAFAACTSCSALTPPNLRRSPVSPRHAPLHWNSYCTPRCHRLRVARREKHETPPITQAFAKCATATPY